MNTQWKKRFSSNTIYSWPTFWISFCFTFVGFPIINADTVSKFPLKSLVVLIASHVATFIFIYLTITIARRIFKAPLPGWTLFTCLLAGLFRGFFMSKLFVVLEMTDSPNYLYRLANAMTVLTVLFVGTTWLVDSSNDQRANLARVEVLKAQIHQSSSFFPEAIERWRNEITAQLRSQLESVPGLISTLTFRESAEKLKNISTQIIKPISAKLAYSREQLDVPVVKPITIPFNLRKEARDASEFGLLNPFALSIINIWLEIPPAFKFFGLNTGLKLVACSALWVYLSASCLNKFLLYRRKSGRSAISPVSFTSILACLAAIAIGLSSFIVKNQASAANGLFFSFFIYINVFWGFAFFTATNRQLEVTERELKALEQTLMWEIARANEIQWQQQRALARRLHGSVQAALIASAVRLDQANAESDSEVRKVALQIIEGSLSELLAPLDGPVNLENTFSQIESVWHGLCEISIDIDGSLKSRLSSDPAAASVADIVTEACSNAVNHSSATEINVMIAQKTEQLLEITIVDNGHAMPSGVAGLGSMFLNDIALEWKLERKGYETRFWAVIPISSQVKEKTR